MTMHWVKRGVIYCPDGNHPELKSHAAIPFGDILNDKLIRIYFSSRNGNGYSVPYYIDVNQNNLKKIDKIGEPILPLGELGTFDECGIMPSWVTSVGDKKYLYYIGWNPQVTVSYRLSIGLAISEDGGDIYRKFSKAPICDRSLSEPFFNTAPCVLFENGLWRMWYVSCTSWHIINGYPEPQYHVKYAESKDGINWKKHGIVCVDYDNDAEAIGRPSVIFTNGIYHMFYSYRKLSDYRSDRDASYKIGFATSTDGISWEKMSSKIGILPSMGGWDSEMIEYCHVISLSDKYFMLYNGNGFGRSGFGYAECNSLKPA